VWSDPTDPRQVVINSEQETLDGIHPDQVITAGLSVLSTRS
jgi:hypothetical protein